MPEGNIANERNPERTRPDCLASDETVFLEKSECHIFKKLTNGSKKDEVRVRHSCYLTVNLRAFSFASFTGNYITETMECCYGSGTRNGS